MNCKTCGAMLPSRNSVCPSCGTASKKPSTGLGAMITTCIFVGLSILMLILTFVFH